MRERGRGCWLCDSVEAVGPGAGTVKPGKDQRQEDKGEFGAAR